ncbi:MAG: peptidase U32 family protein [bacterium]|jgi:putative protease|nr:peptidase U32 family protein [bacterium]
MKKIPELLAPAGDLNAALTAFNNGADAVYAGLSKFNARERTQNFSPEDYGKLMAAAAADGKKVYLTFNTLIKENELVEALENLDRVCRLLPDAVIVQDVGVLSMMRKYFPHIPLHASTQMGIHNSAGMEVAQRLGISRVILERQVTLDELRAIRCKTQIEMEVFIHGALCCSLSGVCLFSSWMGGHSGNRGKCKQPCRRRYYSPDGNGFFFSTNDLYTLEHIPELKRMGIESLKIEGRLRKSDYVASTVKAYRMILDAEGKDVPALLPEARAVLSSALGRKWSAGFFEKNDFDKIVEPAQLGVSGKSCGKVIRSSRGGFEILLTQNLYIGDKIRIQPESGDEGPALTLTKMRQGDKPVYRAAAGEEVFVYCDKKVPLNGRVFKIGTSVKDLRGRIESLPAWQDRIDLEIRVSAGQVTVQVETHPHLNPLRIETDLPPAEKHAVSVGNFTEEFRKTGNEKLGVRRVSVDIKGAYFLSQRDLRHLRQRTNAWLAEQFLPNPRAEFRTETRILSEGKPLHTLACGNDGKIPAEPHYAMLAREQVAAPGEEWILPFFCPEDELPDLKEKITLARQKGIRHFRVTALFHFALLDVFDDIVISSSFPLPVCNHPAFEQLLELGAQKVQLWAELEKPVLKMLAERYGALAEIYVYGRLPILQTRALLPVSGTVNDGRGAAFLIEKQRTFSSLYPSAVFSLPARDLPPVSTYTDQTHARPDEKSVSNFNYERELV